MLTVRPLSLSTNPIRPIILTAAEIHDLRTTLDHVIDLTKRTDDAYQELRSTGIAAGQATP